MAFDQSFNVYGTTPDLKIFWSSQATSTGHYVGAFVYGNVGGLGAPRTVQGLLQQQVPNPRVFPNVGFFVVGQPPTQAQADAFWKSLKPIIESYPQWNTGRGIGGMILWLNALGSISRDTTFGLFTPAPTAQQSPLIYQLDSGTHRLFDAGGDNRLLAVNPNGPAAQVTPAGEMTIALTTPGGPLGLSFGASSYYPGLAISPLTLRVELDVSQPYAGCVGVVNEPAGPGLRNLEFGFEHGLVPQGGIGGSGEQDPFYIFHPLFDGTESFAGAAVTAWLNPLIPTQVAYPTPMPTTLSYNTLQLARGGNAFVSGYRSRFSDKVTLAPAGAQFLATPSLTSRTYFAPSGAFTVSSQGPLPSQYICGLSAVELAGFDSGDTLTFTPAQKASVACTTATNPDGTTYTTFAPAKPADDTGTLVSYAQFTTKAQRNYMSQSEQSPMFAGANRTPTTDPLTLFPTPIRPLLAAAASPLTPFLPLASLDFGPDGQSGNAGMLPAFAAAFERGYVAPTRLQVMQSNPPAFTLPDAWAVTPQGYIAQFSNGQLTSITLGTIDPKTGSTGSLKFDAGTKPLPQNLRNAFLANQQFIVASCLTPDLQNTFSASAKLSGWTFKVTLPNPQDVVPGAYQTVLLIKSASGSIKSLVAEPHAWTAYATFNSTDTDKTGDMLSSWLVSYLAQAEGLYANGSGLTGLQTFVELINDVDWNGYLFLRVPIDLGALDPSLEFLTAGVDPTQFYAHHVGCALNQTSVAGNAYAANSSYIGLVHYLRPGANPEDLTGSPPFVPQSVPYDFQLLTLEASFANSVLASFRSSAQLLMSVLFGDTVLSTSPDPRVTATNAILIYGSVQTLDPTPQNPAGTPHYVFATAKGASSTFFPSSAAFERIEIDRAGVTVGTAVDSQGFRTATFQMSGWFGLLPAQTFDVLSYAAIQFSQLSLDMKFKTGSTSSFTPHTEAVTLSQMPSRSAIANELITAASAAANIVYRPQSLAAGFPLAVTRLLTVTDTSQTPATLGYRALSTQIPLGASSLSAPWYGLEFDLPLGGGGALSSGALFTAKMLFAWAPGGSGQIAVQPGFMLEGPGGTNLTLEVEGVLKLGAAGIYLSQNSKNQFVLQLASLGITVLSKSFPPAGTTNLMLAGVSQGDQRFLGWFGAYVEQTS
jgi:hypothetical protein